MISGESFCPVTERILVSNSVPDWNDSWGVVMSWDETIPGESLCPGMELL